jgi:hypothetical protein
MILRTAAIILLLLLLLRLVARVVYALAVGLRASRGTGPDAGGARPSRRRIKQLAQCPVCGTYFEADRGLPRRAGEAPVCSEPCRTGSRAAADPTASRSGGA